MDPRARTSIDPTTAAGRDSVRNSHRQSVEPPIPPPPPVEKGEIAENEGSNLQKPAKLLIYDHHGDLHVPDVEYSYPEVVPHGYDTGLHTLGPQYYTDPETTRWDDGTKVYVPVYYHNQYNPHEIATNTPGSRGEGGKSTVSPDAPLSLSLSALYNSWKKDAEGYIPERRIWGFRRGVFFSIIGFTIFLLLLAIGVAVGVTLGNKRSSQDAVMVDSSSPEGATAVFSPTGTNSARISVAATGADTTSIPMPTFTISTGIYNFTMSNPQTSGPLCSKVEALTATALYYNGRSSVTPTNLFPTKTVTYQTIKGTPGDYSGAYSTWFTDFTTGFAAATPSVVPGPDNDKYEFPLAENWADFSGNQGLSCRTREKWTITLAENGTARLQRKYWTEKDCYGGAICDCYKIIGDGCTTDWEGEWSEPDRALNDV